MSELQLTDESIFQAAASITAGLLSAKQHQEGFDPDKEWESMFDDVIGKIRNTCPGNVYRS